jgi:four helix bundle protein
MTRDFRELQVWEKAHQLALGVYEATALFPKEETYGITAQMRRAASSVPMNIAEGCGRLGDAELNRFLHIAAGSARELDYQLLLARDLGILNGHAYEALLADVQEVQRMLAAFTRKLRGSVDHGEIKLIANR